MEYPNEKHRRQQVEDSADALAFAVQSSAAANARVLDEAAFERAEATAKALLHGRADGVRDISLNMGGLTIYLRGPRDDTEIEIDVPRRLHNARGENLIDAAALLWAAGCFLRDQERRVANAVADISLKQSLGGVAVGQAHPLSASQGARINRAAFPFR